MQYDVSQIDFQGIYTADVLITTNAQPIAKASAGPCCTHRHCKASLNERYIMTKRDRSMGLPQSAAKLDCLLELTTDAT